MGTLPRKLVALLDSLEKEQSPPGEGDVPFVAWFELMPLRLAMVFARETALDEAALVARDILPGADAERFAARMVGQKKEPLFPGAPTCLTEERVTVTSESESL
jgi:hypothetical protein